MNPHSPLSRDSVFNCFTILPVNCNKPEKTMEKRYKKPFIRDSKIVNSPTINGQEFIKKSIKLF